MKTYAFFFGDIAASVPRMAVNRETVMFFPLVLHPNFHLMTISYHIVIKIAIFVKSLTVLRIKEPV